MASSGRLAIWRVRWVLKRSKKWKSLRKNIKTIRKIFSCCRRHAFPSCASTLHGNLQEIHTASKTPGAGRTPEKTCCSADFETNRTARRSASRGVYLPSCVYYAKNWAGNITRAACAPVAKPRWPHATGRTDPRADDPRQSSKDAYQPAPRMLKWESSALDGRLFIWHVWLQKWHSLQQGRLRT
jgi:hypothetical protein